MKSLTKVMGKEWQGRHLPNVPSALWREIRVTLGADSWGPRQGAGGGSEIGGFWGWLSTLPLWDGRVPKAGPWCKVKRDAQAEQQEVSLRS